jgi:hypothetical protein
MASPRLRALVLGLIVLGILFVGFYGMRTLRAYKEFRRHQPPPAAEAAQRLETDVELIRDWMTIPFIAKMYHVPPNFLFDALGIESAGNREKSLERLNEEYFPERDGFVLTAVKDALLADQERQDRDRLPQPSEPPAATAHP